MEISVNRETRQVADDTTIQSLLAMLSVKPEQVAVAVNGDVIPRAQWPDHTLSPGDQVEIVHVVAGGSNAAGDAADDDPLIIAGKRLKSRLIVGTGKFPDVPTMQAAHAASGADLVTLAVRLINVDAPEQDQLLTHIDRSRYALLPNTAGAYTADDAVYLARLAREVTGTNWIKLEVIGDKDTLWPDVAATIEATKRLVKEGFVVLPYTSPDLVAALRLEEAGAATVMPLAAPIGSGQGLIDWTSLARIIERVSVPVIVDAGLGVPSDAAQALELGADAVLVNTAIARAQNPVLMAEAFKLGVLAGRMAYRAGRIPKRQEAVASSPETGVPGRPPS